MEFGFCLWRGEKQNLAKVIVSPNWTKGIIVLLLLHYHCSNGRNKDASFVHSEGTQLNESKSPH